MSLEPPQLTWSYTLRPLTTHHITYWVCEYLYNYTQQLQTASDDSPQVFKDQGNLVFTSLVKMVATARAMRRWCHWSHNTHPQRSMTGGLYYKTFRLRTMSMSIFSQLTLFRWEKKSPVSAAIVGCTFQILHLGVLLHCPHSNILNVTGGSSSSSGL